MKTILWITSIAMIVGLGIGYYLWHIPKEMTLHQATVRGGVAGVLIFAGQESP